MSMRTVTCQHCGITFDARRKTRKFCSSSCANRSAWKVAKVRSCRHCGTEFPVTGVGDANRQHCSKQCAKNHNAKRIRTWQQGHPEQMKLYYARRDAKNPDGEKNRRRRDRERLIDMLGGACLVCGVANKAWLHIDYVPTTRESRYRHPRHFAYVSKNLHLFRLLCANHHYELTLTGRIEGTNIAQ